MKNHTFSNTLVLRTPLQPVDTDITWPKIQLAFRDSLYREALFVASPPLYNLLCKYENAPSKIEGNELESLKISLYKYYTRFSNRCTPFGLYAFVSTLRFAKESAIEVAQKSIRKASKFDTFFLAKLLAVIEEQKAIRDVLTYYPNTALYVVSDKYRYVEYYFKKETRLHKISGVDRNDYLDQVVDLAKNGTRIKELGAAIGNEHTSAEQVSHFVHTLIDHQFLVSELGITLSGDDYLAHLIKILSEKRFAFYEAQQMVSLLIDLQQKLNALEKNTATVEDYQQLFEYVKQYFDNIPVKKFIQVDAYRDQSDSTLSYAVLKQLRTALQVVNKLSSSPEETNMSRFAKKFVERYEEQELPLTLALDPDIGINYVKKIGAKTPLVEHLMIQKPRADAKTSWSKQKSALFGKLMHAYQQGETEIKLEEKDVNAFEEKENSYYDSFSAFFSSFRENGEDKLYFKSAWGPTATSLIGRFCNLDQSLYDLSQEIIQKEEEIYSNKIVAEIIHLPQARIGNVLHRKNQRAYEIPYLGTSSLPLDRQISVADLLVSVKNGRVVLRSKALQKEVVPRLSNAHNYGADGLPIYHFLCDLALQDSSPIGFSWGQLQYECPYVPRVSFKNIVISRGSWFIKREDINALTKNQDDELFLGRFLAQRKIPAVISLTMGDNEVVINFDNPLSRKVFYSMIKKKAAVTLKEFYFQEPCVTGNFANEFIASALKKVAHKQPELPFVSSDNYKNEAVNNHFSIGDEWLYYKFYCGEKTAEKVLNKGLSPIVEDLKAKGLIEKWFFIRYRDHGGFHLRFRMKLADKEQFSSVINCIKYHITPLENDRIIWKTQVDTYLRETERYGYDSIHATEAIFYHDSECTLQFSHLLEEEIEGEKLRWLFSLLSMDRLLHDFELSLETRVRVMKMLKTGFGAEFNRKGYLNKQINDLYNQEQDNIARFLDKETISERHYPLWNLLQERSITCKASIRELKDLEQAGKLPTPLLLMNVPSYLHMICNRIFLNKERVHEMVVYDFLYKYYNHQLHANNKKYKLVN